MRRRFLSLFSSAAMALFARPLFARDAVLDVRNFGAVGDGVSDDSDAFERAFSAGGQLHIPAGTYIVKKALYVRKSLSIDGASGSKIKFVGSINVCLSVLSANATFKGIILDGDSSSKNEASTILLVGAENCKVNDCHILNGRTFNVRIVSSECSIQGGSIESSLGTAVAIIGSKAKGNVIRGTRIQGNRYFGIWMKDEASENEVSSCFCTGNGLEFVGVTFDCHRNLIFNNEVEGAGDNGISITGFLNLVFDNKCFNNAYHGIGVWGERNLIYRNSCFDNGVSKKYGTEYAGIGLVPGWGGFSRNNLIIENSCYGKKYSSTQRYGLKIAQAWYPVWKKGEEISSNKIYFVAGQSVYRRLGDDRPEGVTLGETAPTTEQGVQTLASGRWKWIGSADASLDRALVKRDGNFRSLLDSIGGVLLPQPIKAEILKSSAPIRFSLFSPNESRGRFRQNSKFDAGWNYFYGNKGEGNFGEFFSNSSSNGNWE